MLRRNFDLIISDTPVFHIGSSDNLEYRSHRGIRILCTLERSTIDFCTYDFAFSMSPHSGRNYYLPAYRLTQEYQLLFREKNAEELFWKKTAFCSFLYSRQWPYGGLMRVNRYPGVAYRNKLFERLSSYKRVSAGGRVANNIGGVIQLREQLDFRQACKFSIAFENASASGYTTEKIVDAFVSGTVPIYWGDPLIHKHFNSKAFINCADYSSWDEVVEKIIEIDQDDDLYMQYLSEPPFVDGREPEFLKEENIVARWRDIFQTDEKPRAQQWRYRPCSDFRYFVRRAVFSMQISDGY